MPDSGSCLLHWARRHPNRVYQPVDPRPAKDRPEFSVGEWIKAPDFGNYGRIIAIDDDGVTVHFIAPDGKEATKKFTWDELRPDPSSIVATPTMSNDEFINANLDQRFLIKGILPAGQNCVIGGRSKTLKTGIMLDMAYSLATGSMFLRTFEVPEAVTVAVLSGESGAYVIRETAKRIANARGQVLSGAKMRWGFDLPRLSKDDHRAALEQMIVEHQVQVVIIDPLYLSLLDAMQAASASNLYAMGSYLLPLSELAASHGITLIILHHFRKASTGGASGREKFEPPELEDLSLSGVGEWARSWFLLSRREKYEPGSGIHRLWASVGGSAGHSQLLAIDVDEGHIDDPGGRKWDVKIANSGDVRAAARKAQSETRAAEYRERLLTALRIHPDGETARVICLSSGLRNDVFNATVAPLVESGIVEIFDKRKANQNCKFYRLKPSTDV